MVSLVWNDALLLCRCAETVCQKVTDSLRLLWAVIGGFIDYLTGVMHDISREYRSVSRILDREKEAEKKRMRRVSTARFLRYSVLTCSGSLLGHSLWYSVPACWLYRNPYHSRINSLYSVSCDWSDT